MTQIVPGTQETIQARDFPPHVTVILKVTFPNGDTMQRLATTDGAGSTTFSYAQPASEITRHHRVAQVVVQTDTASSPLEATGSYRIKFGVIDVSAEPRTQTPGKTVNIYTHTDPGALVKVGVRLSSVDHLKGDTNSKGWLKLAFTVPNKLKQGRHITLRARVRLPKGYYTTSTTFTVG